MADQASPGESDSSGGRISLERHTAQSWRAHTLAPDFDVEDVWQLPITVSADDDIALVRERLFAALGNTSDGGVAGFLFAVRLKLGEVFGWDDTDGEAVDPAPGSLRERFATEEGLSVEDLPGRGDGDQFTPVYQFENESLDELANATAHAGLHLGKVALDDNGERFGVQMAILVKANGRLGRLYMAGIKPFRHFIVYPTLLRHIANEFSQ